MTFEQLRIFLVVAETLNMRRAGELLHLTQPAVSASIAALESRHATRLFERVGRGLELSAAGRSFLPEAQAVLSRAEAAERVLSDLSGLLRGEVRLAASQTVADYWLPSRIARFVEAHAGIGVSLVAGNSAQSAAAVLSGEADLAFVEGKVDADLLRVQRVGGDRLGLYVAPGHPLAKRRAGVSALRKAAWVFRERGSGTRDHLEAGLARHGLLVDTLEVRLVLPSNGAVLGAIEAGGLVGGVSDLAAESRAALGRLVRLDWELPARDFFVLTHRGRGSSRAAGAFLEFAAG